MSTLTDDLLELRELKLDYDTVYKEAKELKAAFERKQNEIYARMESERVGGHKIDGIANFVRTETVYAQVQDRSAFLEWARENKPEFVEERERKEDGILNEFARQCLDDGVPLPPGLGLNIKQYISQRAA